VITHKTGAARNNKRSTSPAWASEPFSFILPVNWRSVNAPRTSATKHSAFEVFSVVRNQESSSRFESRVHRAHSSSAIVISARVSPIHNPDSPHFMGKHSSAPSGNPKIQ